MNTTYPIIISLACLAMAAMACQPDRLLRGSVQTVPQTGAEVDGDVYASGQPVANAKIRYICPDEADSYEMEPVFSDEQGNFEYSSFWSWTRECHFEVSHDDYHPQIFELEKYCLNRHRQGCRYVVIQAELVSRQ